MIYRILSAPLAQRHDPHPPCSSSTASSPKCSPSTPMARALSDCTNAAPGPTADADPFFSEYASAPAHKKQASHLLFPSAKPNTSPLPPTPPPTPSPSPTKAKSQRDSTRVASLPGQRLRSSSARVASVTARLKAPPTVRLSLSNASVATSVVPFPSATSDAPQRPLSSPRSKSSPLPVPTLNTSTNLGPSVPLPNSPISFPSPLPENLEDAEGPDADAMAVDVHPPCTPGPSLLQSELAPWSVPARKRRHAHLATPTPAPPRGSAKRARLLRSLLALDCASSVSSSPSSPLASACAAAGECEVITDLRALDGILAARLGARGASIGDADADSGERALSPQQLVASLILQRSERRSSSKKKRRAVAYTEAAARVEGCVVERRPSPLRAVMVFGEEEDGDVVEDVEMDMVC
ncbi:hypothetical protein CONPUDRAFT_135323 [Coniophora puteana RWD-64-598 SS2]|uniref:Uncharacterized protein n=1 Tax=Coniophora puteana (strain RWD-64-598) TaxID=741705 RepID=A0A5M3N2U2_CONPW|nr:uncharacterized protein CONPUDRAFT_135323 [Coniophora puteana RWD-64-598 SS2]EIW85688.1 hypothetical protein CONPUDRAFT_135323 [Coniophora puteana RWD-64-598 SS2]